MNSEGDPLVSILFQECVGGSDVSDADKVDKIPLCALKQRI